MYKITLKIFLLIFIFFLLGYGVSWGLSYIERNVPLDGYLEYLVNRNKEYVEDNSIMNSLNETTPVEDTGSNEIEDFGIPVHISIDSVGINLDIKVGEYDYNNQTWTLTNGSAYWANLSDSILMENSNTVIYAHNQVNEFYKTKYLKVGDVIKIKTDQGKETGNFNQKHRCSCIETNFQPRRVCRTAKSKRHRCGISAPSTKRRSAAGSRAP